MHINKPARSAQFTPGPWYPHYAKADHCLSSSVWGQEPGNQVAVVGGKSLQTMNANARIIAAAPAMYEALKQALIIVESAYLDDYAKRKQHCTDDEAGMSSDEQASFEALQLVKAAIAKAEGR